MAQKFLTGVQLTDGGAGSPALSFSSDTNTGIYRSADDHVNISVGGTNMFKVSSAGITSSVNVYSGTSGQFRNYAGIWKATTGASGGDAQFILNGKTIMHIDEADERVGIGNTDPYAKLHITGADSTASAIRQSRTGTVIWDQAIDSSGRLQWGTRASEGGTRTVRFTLDDNGNVGVGTGAPGYTLDVSGSLRATGESTFTNNLLFPDNSQIKLGTGQDLEIYHDGSNSRIENNTGHLYIRNDANNSDIIFQTDDGNDSVETYFFLDGSAGGTNPITIFPDSSYLKFGSSQDLSIAHTGSYSEISHNGTGNLIIQNTTDDADIILKSDNGSGGTADYLIIDGSQVSIRMKRKTKWDDNIKATFGDGEDLQIYHNAADSFYDHYNTGVVYFRQLTTDGDISFWNDNGSGGTAEYFRVDGGQEKTLFIKNTEHQDGIRAQFGGSGDFSIFHDGTNARLYNDTGDFYIRNNADDKDIYFQSDNGSGGVATYFFLDGSSVTTQFYKTIKLYDDAQIYIGDDNDLRFYHNGTSNIDNYTGNLDIIQRHNDGDIRFYNDDGSGGTTEYFRIDGGATKTIISKAFQFFDNVKAEFGDSSDLKIFHDGSGSKVENYVGNLTIQQRADDSDIVFQCDDGSGDLTDYFRLDGSATNMKVSKDMRFLTSVDAEFGTGGDFKIYHDGSNQYLDMINSGTGNIVIQNQNDDADIIFKSDNGSGGIATYMSIDGAEEQVRFFKPTEHGDGVLARFGNSGDLRIYHSGSHSFIDGSSGTGSLYIRPGSGNTVQIEDKDGNDMITASPTQVRLLYNNSEKLATTNTGVSITGDLIVSGTTTTVNQTNLDISDNIIGLNRGASTNTNDSGIIIERGTTGDNAAILWDESSDDFVFGLTTATPSATGNVALSDFRGIRTGPITVSGNLTVGADSDRLVTLGRAKVGSYVSDYAYFSHFDYGTLSNYALNQSPTGNTSINAPTGGHVQLKINNSAKVTLVGDRVGIGTASPAVGLHVNDQAFRVQSSSNTRGVNINTNGEIQQTSSSSDWLHLQRGHNGLVAIGYESNSNLYVKNSVGIGTNSPVRKFHVIDTNTYPGRIAYDANNYMDLGYDSLNVKGGNMFFRNDGTTRMILSTDGKLKINSSTAPVKTLEIEVNNSDNVITTGNGISGGVAGNGLLIRNSNTATNTYANLDFRANNADGRIAYQYKGSTNVGDFHFITDNTNNLLSAMVIKNDGKVGIGAVAPSEKLEVNGNILVNKGTTNRTAYLSDDGLYISRTTVANSYPLKIVANSSNSNNLDIYARSQISLILNSTTRLVANDSGNVGIGTTSPSSRLHVAGDIRTDNSIIFTGTGFINSNSTNLELETVSNKDIILKPQGTGKVGIGTTAPQTNTKLEVSGALKAGNKTSWSDRDGAALTTTGRVVAGLTGNANGNGASALYIFTCYGGNGYQRIVYSCRNQSGTWVVNKDIDEGVDAMDVVASTPSSGSAVTFTFKGRTSSQSYTASVFIEHMGHNLDTQYVG